MGTGIGVVLLAVGAVLAFAVNATVTSIDLVLVGAILMLAGSTILLMVMMRWTPRRRMPFDPYGAREQTADKVTQRY